jgi:hypothetical protein
LTIWFCPPSESSTARTSAWSPPTRACDTLRDGAAEEGWRVTGDGPVLAGAGPGGRIGCRYLALTRFLPLRLIDLQV